MPAPRATCPNCGAPVEFRWSGAVQAVCPHCRSVLVRRDLDLSKVGEVAELPPDPSPIQIGTTGRFENDAFTVTGRIVYAYDSGTWNEWHLAFEAGTSGWLSDAQLEYSVYRQIAKPGDIPADSTLTVGQRYGLHGASFAVTTLTHAHYRGVDGELPFEYWDKEDVLFADLATEDGQLATIDYSESPPFLFRGIYVDFDALQLKNLKPVPAGPEAKTSGFNCRNCGAAIELRAALFTKTVACTSCGALQDPSDPNVLVLQTFAKRERITPRIPPGSRGHLHGHDFDVIGFQRRSIVVDGETYSWDEYLLFNREHGFRYLSEYQGHWNDIRNARGMPRQTRSGDKPAALFNGRTFDGFQTAVARTDYVLGEFPWQVRANDTATVTDYVDPPLMLSAERTPQEVTWSLGEYVPGRQIWDAFKLPGDPPPAVGVYANQPSPYAGKAARYWGLYALFVLLLLAVCAVRLLSAARENIFQGSYVFQPGTQEASFVTPVFEIGSRASNVEIEVRTNLRNNWIYLNMTLINADTGDAFDFGREVSYYFGSDSDGAWTEGSMQDSAVLPTLPVGRYYLRIEPESEASSQPISYSVVVLRDVPSPLYYLIALGVLLLPPIVVTMRSSAFEARRWQESDFGDSDDDDDDNGDSSSDSDD